MNRSILLLALVFCLCIGCSKQALDSTTAFSSIDHKLKGQKQALLVYIGRVGSHCDFAQIGNNSFPVDLNPDKIYEMVTVRKAGYITVAPDGKDFWKVALTPQGQSFLDAEHQKLFDHETPNGCDFMVVDFPVARPVAVKVMNVSGDENTAEADYVWQWKLTELGNALQENGSVYRTLSPATQHELRDWLAKNVYAPSISLPLPADQELTKTYEATAQFKKAEDGWRIQ